MTDHVPDRRSSRYQRHHRSISLHLLFSSSSSLFSSAILFLSICSIALPAYCLPVYLVTGLPTVYSVWLTSLELLDTALLTAPLSPSRLVLIRRLPSSLSCFLSVSTSYLDSHGCRLPSGSYCRLLELILTVTSTLYVLGYRPAHEPMR